MALWTRKRPRPSRISHPPYSRPWRLRTWNNALPRSRLNRRSESGRLMQSRRSMTPSEERRNSLSIRSRITHLEKLRNEQMFAAHREECKRRSEEELGFFAEHGYWPEASAGNKSRPKGQS